MAKTVLLVMTIVDLVTLIVHLEALVDQETVAVAKALEVDSLVRVIGFARVVKIRTLHGVTNAIAVKSQKVMTVDQAEVVEVEAAAAAAVDSVSSHSLKKLFKLFFAGKAILSLMKP